MAIQTKWKVMDGKEGVDLNNVVTSLDYAANPAVLDSPQPPANLGDRVQGSFGSEWMYVVASATVTAFNMLAINRNFGAINITTAVQASGIYTFGFLQCQGLVSTDGSLKNAQPGDTFWALMKCGQGARANVVGSISVGAGAKLYVSGDVPGQLTTSTTVSTAAALQIIGIFAAASATTGGATATPTSCELGMYSYPFPSVLISVQAASV